MANLRHWTLTAIVVSWVVGVLMAAFVIPTPRYYSCPRERSIALHAAQEGRMIVYAGDVQDQCQLNEVVHEYWLSLNQLPVLYR